MKTYEATHRISGAIYHVKGMMDEKGIHGPYKLQSFLCEGKRYDLRYDSDTRTHSGGWFPAGDYRFDEIANANM